VVKDHLPVAVAAAVILGAASAAPLPADGRAVVVCVAVGLLAWTAWVRGGSAALRALIVCAFIAGALDARFVQSLDAPVVPEHTARYACTVIGDRRIAAFSSSFSCRTDDGNNLEILASGRAPVVGARVLVRGRLAPFDEARNPGEPSERDLQRDRGLRARLSSAQVLATLPPRDGFSVRLARVREWALGQLRARVPEPQASLIAGALWGERTNLPPDLRAEFQETGTVHVLVTAGLHLGVVVALAMWLFALLRVPRVAACLGGIGCAWAYAIAASAHIPSMRAAAMISVALIARALGRRALSWNAFAVAATLIALARPLDVTGASFLLSFSCVGAILAWAGPLQDALRVRTRLPHLVREALAVAGATQLGTWPLTAAIFLQFAPYALLANLLVVPVVGITMLCAGAQLALSWAPPLAQACANIASWGASWMIAVVGSISALPFAKIPMTPAPAWCICIYDAALLGVPWLWKRGARALAVAAATCGIALVLWPPRASDANLRVTVLDVGQADGIVIRTPRGHALLVDAGGRLERGSQTPDDSVAERVGERIVIPYLLRSGIHALDAIVLTHPHGDHAGGVAPTMRALRVAKFADGGQTYGGGAYRDALRTAYAKRIPIVYPRAGDVWKTDDGVTMTFVGPSLPFIHGGSNDVNDNSIAFVLQYRHFRMLLTGDAGTAAEARFLKEGIALHVDVLKVGHHGSAYGSSPAFLAAVHPRYAIISVGRHNLFGHPAPSTVARLKSIGATVYRTDQNGAVTVTTDGSTYSVWPQLR
jgi:competence protein ComEC